MNIDVRYRGKRFISFLSVTFVLMLGYFFGNPEVFGSFSTTIGLLYGAYLTGQSATDYVKAKNNANN